MSVDGILYYSVMTEQEAGGHGRDAALSRAGVALAMRAIAALAPARVLGADGAVDIARWEAPPRGKPRYRGGPDFSISHAGRYVACATASAGAIGLDIECDERIESMTLATIADPAELELAQRLGKRELWVRKEAALKAGGGGVERIGAVRVSEHAAWFDERRYHFQRVDPFAPATVAVAVATSEPAVALAVRELPFTLLVGEDALRVS